MKKSISFVLVLTMVLGIMAPMVGFAEENNTSMEELYGLMKGRFSGLSKEDLSGSESLVLKLNKERKEIIKELDENEKNYLKELGITKEYYDEVYETLTKDKDDIKGKVIKIIESESYVDVEDDIKSLATTFYKLLPVGVKDIITENATTEQTRINLFAALFNEFQNVKIGTGDYQDGKYIKLDITKIEDRHIERANGVINEVEGVIGENLLTTQHLKISNKLISSTLGVLTLDETNMVGNLLEKAKLIEKNSIPTETPGTGGGTGGGTVTPPTTPSKPGTTITEKDVKVETVDGVKHITIKEKEAITVIKALRKESGKDKPVVAKVELDSVEGENLSINLTEKIVRALLEEKVDLHIITKDIEYLIPYNALSSKLIPEGAIVRIRTDNLDKSILEDVIEENHNAKKVVDIYIEVVKGDKVTKVSKFDAPITVKVNVKGLGNKDMLAVYFFDEEDNSLEFVTGKIEGNQAILVLNHFSKYAILESTKTFSDVKNHWSKLYVESMVAKNVVNGYSDETFKPENNITRGEFAKLVVNALEEDLVKYKGEFTDVKASHWSADYIATMKELGLIKGYGDGTFKPEAEITRAEMAMILGEILDVEVTEQESTNLLLEFKDNKDIPNWARESVAIVLKSKIMIGSNGKFLPTDNATRAESVTTMYRVY